MSISKKVLFAAIRNDLDRLMNAFDRRPLYLKLYTKYFKKVRPTRICSTWECDLCWCPSQCELLLHYNGKMFMLYLRWRHSDPWTADLIEMRDAVELYQAGHDDWHSLIIPVFKDTALSECKLAAIEAAKRYLHNYY